MSGYEHFNSASYPNHDSRMKRARMKLEMKAKTVKCAQSNVSLPMVELHRGYNLFMSDDVEPKDKNRGYNLSDIKPEEKIKCMGCNTQEGYAFIWHSRRSTEKGKQRIMCLDCVFDSMDKKIVAKLSTNDPCVNNNSESKGDEKQGKVEEGESK